MSAVIKTNLIADLVGRNQDLTLLATRSSVPRNVRSQQGCNVTYLRGEESEGNVSYFVDPLKLLQI